jgi:hypothetical protein
MIHDGLMIEVAALSNGSGGAVFDTDLRADLIWLVVFDKF